MIYDDQTSSAMNYYEELGVGPDATEQEIRKAHRRLVKLMHPDAQPDHNLKMLAETQMRRLNSIVSTLLDSEQRRSYDEELHEASHTPNKQSRLPAWRGIPWWLASAVGAVVLTLAAVWLWADHLGSGMGSRPRVVVPVSERSPVLASPPGRTAQASDPSGSPIGSASYTPPGSASQPLPPISDQPAANGGVSTAVVPDAPADPKITAKNKEEQRIEAIPKPAVIAENHAPASTKSSITPSVQVRDQAVKKQSTVQVLVPSKPAQTKPVVVAHNVDPKQVPLASVKTPFVRQPPPAITKPVTTDEAKNSPVPVPAPKKVFYLPAGSVIARAAPTNKGGSQLPPPPGVAQPATRDYSAAALPTANLPAAVPPKLAVVTTAAAAGGSAVVINPHDPLEGEWVYAPKEPEKRKPGFYPPEFIDLKLFGVGDPGNLKGQYSAKYLVTDKPVTPEVSFDLASISKGSRKFVWQSSNGTRGTLSIDPIDDRTIRIDWHTTSAVRGPALTSGTATLVRRQ